MKKKVFSLMMTLLLAFMGVAKADVVTIGDGTSTTYVTPFNSLWGYSFVEQVYTADEIGTAGTINSISFYLSSGSQTNSVDVFMKNVSRTEFSGTDDYEAVTASDMVFSGTVTFSAGWSTITLDTPFQYDGTSNLMIALHEYTSGYSTLYFNYTSATNKVITFHSDGANPDPYSLTNYTGNKYTSEKRANIQIDITTGGGQGGEEVVVEIGDGTSTYYYYPVNMYFNYSLTEQIYTADEIGTAGSITAISFYYDYTSSFSMDNVTLYMKNVTRDAFAGNSDMEPLALGDIVWTGTLSASAAGWVTITLDTPFAYDGTSNLLVAAFDGTSGYPGSSYKFRTTSYDSYRGINWYSDSYTPDPYNTASGYSGSKNYTQYRNNIQLSITTDGGDTPGEDAGLHTLATYGVGEEVEEMIDFLYIERPNGAWMEPYHFQLYNDGAEDVDVLYIDFLHNNGYFSMAEGTEYPITVAHTGLEGAVDLYINTNTDWTDTEEINSLLAVNTNERSTHLYEIVAAPYEPYCPDVVEKAYNIGTLTNDEWRMYASEMWEEENPNEPYNLHANYDLPDFEENIPDGYDAVMKFTVDHDVMLNAYVNEGENGKVVLYRSDFAGEAGPMADNYYEGRPFVNVPGGGGGPQPAFQAQVGSGTSTSGYMPFYCFYNYSISAQLYRADELAAAGVNTAPMNSISYECSATNGNTQNGISIWMANVTDNVIPSSSPLASGMTKVYEGSCTPTVGWNEFVFNQGTFAWDGSSNVMVLFQRNNGNWASGISWKVDALTYAATGYSYNDSDGAYNVMNNSYLFGTSGYSYGSTVSSRANTIFKSNGGRYEAGERTVILQEGFENGLNGWTMYNCNSSTGVNNGYTTHSGDYLFRFYYTTNYPQYLISPMLNGTENGVDVSFYYMAYSSSYPETFQVGYSTTTNDVSAFTFGSTVTATNTSSYLEYTESFPAGTKYVAVKCTSDDQFYLFVDDFTFSTSGAPTPVDPTQPTAYSAGPVIENLNVLAGSYYLLASSTDEDFEVVINAEDLPCPIEAVTNIYPEDNALDIPATNLTLQWTLNDYANEWRLVFGSTYYPEDEPEHPATYITEWSANLAESLRITDYVELWENTNYFWRIEQRSNAGTDYECVTSGPVFGFTTSFDIPQNLQVNGAGETNIFETEEDVTLTWNRIYDRNRNDDRTFRRYRIYWNGELYDETTDNDVNEVSYTIPNAEFHYNMVPHVPELFNVTAVYDEGESPMSNTVAVHVSGYGTISGTVYEQDEVTPIGGVTVVVTGTNEFGGAEEYTFTTDAQGFYQGQVHVGEYSDAMAYMDGYQEVQTTHSLPFNVVYQQTTPNVDFIMDETFYYPAHVCAHTVYVPGVQGDTLVQVWWEGWASEGGGFVPGGAFEAQIGDGTGTLTYAPFHTLWNYSFSETLYRADELAEAGVTGAAMTSLSYYVASTSCTTPQNNISIWMANVTDNELTTTSHITNNMTLVYTGNNVLPVAGQWNEFVFNEGNFSWDGQSNIVILCTRNNGTYQGSVSWQTHNPGFLATTYAYSDTNGGYYAATSPLTGLYSSSTNRPNIIMKAGGREAAIGDMNRALHHFNIYRTDCYNDGPYNSDNTVFLASVWRPDTSYVDVQWPEVPVGVYKYGVSAVYSGNQADNPNNPRVDYPFEDRESEIMWSDQCGPCIDKDMQTDITVNVVCNSADSPEGCVVSFTNLNEGEQFNHPQPSITLDGSGFQAVTPFRKGNYLVTVYLPGYELLQVEESIWGHRDLRYVLTEIIYGVKDLYVSRTGWAMWQPETWEDYPIPSGAVVGPTIIDFETGDFSQFAFTNTSAYAWTVVNEGRGYCMKSGNAGIASSTSTISATMNYTMDGTVEFDANCMGEGTSTFWDKCIFKIDGAQMFSHGADVTGWHNYSYPVTAGEHTFTWEYSKDGSVNPTGDCFLVDNINFNIGGSRAVAEERHLEGYKIMCTSLDDEPIFNHNTPVDQPFCQLTTVDPWSGQPMLIEGERYKVKVATIYSTGQSPWSEAVIWQYEPCDHWGPVDEVTAGTLPQGNHIEWVFEHGHNQWIDPNAPGEGGEASTFSFDCDGGMPTGWTTIDADGDGYTWVSSTTPGNYHNAGVDLTGNGHNGSDAFVISGSWINQPGQALTPDNYLVSPQVNLVAGSTFSFWACAQDASYPADHFGVFVSDNGTSDWTMINEWTMTAKSGGNVMSAGRHGVRAQGSWYQYTVDLSAFAGQKYIAIRHFNCTDQFILNVDDLELTAGAKGDNDGISLYHDQEIYRQYAEDGVLLNFLGIDNIGFRAYLLFNIVKDNRFSMTAENSYGQFVLNAAYEMDNFMSEFEGFYEQTSYNFSLLSKMDIYNQMNEWKSAVSPDYYNSIIMDVALSNARVENDQCINSLPFCTTDVIEFEAASTSSTAQEEGMDDGCIGSSYNPSFYHMRIHDAGPFVIHMEGHDPNNGTTRDIDFCMWGPYTEQEVMSGYACTHLTGDKIMDCCYSASYTEDCYLGYPEGQHQHNTGHGNINYHVPEVGEYYILMITNFSQQPCVINFTKTEGEGETDCDIVTPSDIIGFLITLDGEYLTIVGPDDREYTHDGEFGDHEYCVRPIYPGPAILSDTNYYFSMGCPVCASTNGDVTCEPGNPIYAEVNNTDDQVHIWWGEQPTPPEPEEGDTFVYDFENSSLDGLILIDADGDGYNWNLSSATMGTGYGHNASVDMVFSQSYDNNYGALTPDNYIVFPQSNIANGSTFSFWACGQDASWASEHFGVAVSTTGTNASDFTTIQEWTMTAKGTKAVRDGRDQGNWYQYSVDLSDYAGMEVYIAIRHFNCTDMFYLDVDDVMLGIANKGNRDGIIGYNIYRSTDNVDYVLIATVDGDVTEYFDAPGAGTYYYQVTALYEGCESEPAISGENPDQNYVVVGVTGIGENSDNVNLFPNPTKGNVTIQAMNMHRITVVSVLGQVVFDTELDQDEYILNMAKFNTGMYMVRVYTDEGVTVKRVTVLH